MNPFTEVPQVLPPTAGQQATELRKAGMEAALAKKEKDQEEFLALLDKIENLEWHRMPLKMLVILLMQKPTKGGRDEPPIYMTPQQALIYATEIKRHNEGCDNPSLWLSPFGNDCWPDLSTMKVNVTVEGQRKIAARRGDLGIPEWSAVARPFGKGVEKKLSWQTEDIGMKCSIPVGQKAVSAVAWLSLWFKNTPIWRENWEHMLRVRSEGLCYEAITGVGISQPHTDKEVEAVAEFKDSPVSEFKFVAPNEKGEK